MEPVGGAKERQLAITVKPVEGQLEYHSERQLEYHSETCGRGNWNITVKPVGGAIGISQ